MISEALILMAGTGSRLQSVRENIPKPLIQIAGRAVFSYTIEALQQAAIKTVHVITGYNSEPLISGLKSLMPATMTLQEIHNPEWRKQNGISVLAAKPYLTSPFLLLMGDHLFGPAIVDLLIRESDPNVLNVAIDRKINAIFDLDDAMKVKTKANRVEAIGKSLDGYDAIDTGAFACPVSFFDHLERARKNDDCSLADGVRAMAEAGKVRAIDIGDAWWQDIDTPEMLAAAEKSLTS